MADWNEAQMNTTPPIPKANYGEPNSEAGLKRRKHPPRENELKLLEDLTAFPNLAAMLHAESLLKQTKRFNSQATMKAFKSDAQDIGNASTVDDKEEDNYKLFQADKNDIPAEVIDLTLSSPEKDVALELSNTMNVEDLTSPSYADLKAGEQPEKCNPHELSGTIAAPLFPLPEDIYPRMLFVDARDGEPCKQVSRSVRSKSKSVITEENVVLQKLLRKWRYFDSGDEISRMEGQTIKLTGRKSRKACYICGDLQHSGKKCPKHRICFSCKGRGHLAADCAKSNENCVNICLRCGDSGHDLFSCNNEYSQDDLKNIQCYVCNKFGHICCGNYSHITPATVSCYNCGVSGHSGLECPKPHLDKRGSRPPPICYKCGEEGHVARKCINSSEPAGDAEPNDAATNQSQKSSRKSKTYRQGRFKKKKMTGLLESMPE